MRLSSMLLETRGSLHLLQSYTCSSRNFALTGDPINIDWEGDEDAFMIIEADLTGPGRLALIFNNDTGGNYRNSGWINISGSIPAVSADTDHGQIAELETCGLLYGSISMRSGIYKCGEFLNMHVSGSSLYAHCRRYCPVWKSTAEITNVKLATPPGSGGSASGWLKVYVQRMI